jgi:protease-4
MRQFLKQIFASVLGTVIALGVFATVGATGLVFLIFSAASWTETANLKDKSILVLDLSVPITDTEPASEVGEVLLGNSSYTLPLRSVLRTLEAAQNDDKIVALFLDGSQLAGGSGSGYAVMTEVREAIEKFRESGKKVIAYDVDFAESEYYLGSVADEVILNPMGSLEMNGLASEQMFLAGALEKYGVGVQIIRVGKYKSAVEPLIQNEFSPENEAQLQALLNDLWQNYLNTVTTSREVETAKLQGIADQQGFLLPDDALSNGLVDRIAYFDEVIADFRDLTGENEEDSTFSQVTISQYRDRYLKPAKNTFADKQVAVVYAEGSIVNGQGGLEDIGGDRFAEVLRDLRLDDEVKAVVLRINSPGGSATASEVILREVQLTAKEKPVVVSMGNVAASGGYWMATGATHIFAEPNTITGSIGVFGVLPNVEKLAENQGIAWDVVETGDLASSGTLSRPKTPQELAQYQKAVDTIYDQFLSKVANSRDLPKEEVAQIAQGRVWSGEDAVEIGLVDTIGGLESAIAHAAKIADLDLEYGIQEYPDNPTLEEQLLEQVFGNKKTKSLDPLTQEFLKLKEELDIFRTLNDPKGVYVRLPFSLRID